MFLSDLFDLYEIFRTSSLRDVQSPENFQKVMKDCFHYFLVFVGRDPRAVVSGRTQSVHPLKRRERHSKVPPFHRPQRRRSCGGGTSRGRNGSLSSRKGINSSRHLEVVCRLRGFVSAGVKVCQGLSCRDACDSPTPLSPVYQRTEC